MLEEDLELSKLAAEDMESRFEKLSPESEADGLFALESSTIVLNVANVYRHKPHHYKYKESF